MSLRISIVIFRTASWRYSSNFSHYSNQIGYIDNIYNWACEIYLDIFFFSFALLDGKPISIYAGKKLKMAYILQGMVIIFCPTIYNYPGHNLILLTPKLWEV